MKIWASEPAFVGLYLENGKGTSHSPGRGCVPPTILLGVRVLLSPYLTPLSRKENEMNIVDSIKIRPGELKSGDVMMLTVICYIDRWDNEIVAKIYKAKADQDVSSIPQGPKVAEVRSEKSPGYDLMRLLFPVVMYEMENLKAELTKRLGDE